MALKAFLDSLAGLPENIAKEYIKGDDGKFRLDVEGAEDTGALKRAKEHEKQARKTAEDALRAAQEQVEKLTEERDGILRGAIPKADVEKLEGSWKEKLSKQEKELNSQIKTLNGHVQTMLVDNVAQSLAQQISKSPELLLPHVRSRLKAELVDGKPTTRVLAQDGSVSALTVDDLRKEMVANPAFAPIIIGSKGSGGGAAGGQGGSGAPGKLDYSKATPKQIAEHIKAQKEASGG